MIHHKNLGKLEKSHHVPNSLEINTTEFGVSLVDFQKFKSEFFLLILKV